MGVNVENYENFPKKGPAIIVSNHNSHIDTLILMSLFHNYEIPYIHPAAALDYFFNTKFKSFVFRKLIGMVPISRKVNKDNIDSIFDEANKILDNNEILIIFPEGTRGSNCELQQFKTGFARIAQKYPSVPIIPVYIDGPDKILPKGTLLWIPFIANVYVGEALYYDNTSAKDFAAKVRNIVWNLQQAHKNREEL